MSLAVRALIAVTTALVTAAVSTSWADERVEPAALGPEPVTVLVDIEHSAFTPSALTVVEGTEVRFVVVNRDPINHELIVGPAEVHDRHRDGTEAEHGAVAGEVSVGALQRAVTTYAFDEAGTVEMACHLPGHYDYGMRGAIEVVAR